MKHITWFLLKRYLILSWLHKNKHKSGSAMGVFIPVLGVAVGVFAFTVVLSIMGGFVENIHRNLFILQSNLQVIAPQNQLFKAQNQLLESIQKSSQNIKEVAPFLKGDVILQAKNKVTMATLEAIPTNNSKDILKLYQSTSAPTSILNTYQRKSKNPHSPLFPTVILGWELLQDLNLNVGDTVTIMSTQPEEGPLGLAPKQYPVLIAGYFESGDFILDKKHLFSSLKTAEDFFDIQGQWSGIHVQLWQPDLAKETELDIQKQLPQVQVQSWMETNGALLKALQLEHYGMAFVMAMIILVGCFSISISLVLSVRRKSKEMAILRTIGFTEKDLGLLYLSQGIVIGFCGVLLGMVLGLSTLYALHNNIIPFLSQAYSHEGFPVKINGNELLAVSIGSIVLATLASLWPSKEVKSLQVVEILSIRH